MSFNSFVKVGIAAILLCLIGSRVDLDAALALMSGARPSWIFFALATSFAIILADAAYWTVSMRAVGCRMELKPALAGGKPVFLTGDFNEPSSLDWTARAAAAGRCPVAVEYPSTLAVMQAGMRDAYRTAHPDELAHPGHTWTPTTRPDDPKDRHDRIDFVFLAGTSVSVKHCAVVGESSRYAGLVVQPYPSDHRAVVATMEWED